MFNSISNDRILARDVEATVVPSGEPALLPAGMKVNITHRLGGNFTVVCDIGMFRILGKDCDAIGETVEAAGSAQSAGETTEFGSFGTAEHPGHTGAPDEDALWNALKTVYDPEVPVDIVNLGLIYKLEVLPLGNNRYSVQVAMTVTAPGCGMGPIIAEDARNRLLAVPGANEVRVEIVLDPPWTQDMITEEGKMELGLI
ncbi:MAG: iron-sulfur cluster assembly protein [Opitutae bacterium]|nr:iron-sulfur cluster assembly protein [Opitutae bacterium]MCD8299539.1 iron-sulfur cluster assembly protein [Opitutae bacterium]